MPARGATPRRTAPSGEEDGRDAGED
ncbi:MAG: hypothetical protein QOE44_1406, partial [Solirubrobacteraceae bacterium]|nr:hypothetical protein [Solirubrobacteraceae bacterium]